MLAPRLGGLSQSLWSRFPKAKVKAVTGLGSSLETLGRIHFLAQ